VKQQGESLVIQTVLLACVGRFLAQIRQSTVFLGTDQAINHLAGALCSTCIMHDCASNPLSLLNIGQAHMMPGSTTDKGQNQLQGMPGPVIDLSKQHLPSPLKGMGVADLAVAGAAVWPAAAVPAASPDAILKLLHQHHQLLGRLTASNEHSAATAAAPGSNQFPTASPAQHGCSQTRSTTSAAAAASAIAHGVKAFNTGAGSEGADDAASAAVSAVLAAVAAAAAAADAADKLQVRKGLSGASCFRPTACQPVLSNVPAGSWPLLGTCVQTAVNAQLWQLAA
jgi:hypothetical protein